MTIKSLSSELFSNVIPKVSVVIPCYNQGQYVIESLDSVLNQTYQNIEVIIVNDGSDDEHTASILNQIDLKTVQVHHTPNQGLAAARNKGIQMAEGSFILPLDADDFIAPEYVEQAVAVLKEKIDVGIVYCRARLFGAVDTEWILPSFSLTEMLLDNVIFCSAMFRKSDWQAVGGYDPGMIYGWEDYDFWLSLIERGCGVYQIPKILFSYRVASGSMVRSKERWQKVAMFKRVFERHQKIFADNIEVWINSLLDVREKYYTSKLYIDTGNGIGEANCLSRKIDQETVRIEFSLDGFDQITALRFDPVDVPAVVEVFEISLTTKDGIRTVVSKFSDNSIGMEEGKMYFDTNDPNCFLDLKTEQLQNLKSITVKLRFMALAADALQQIVQFQQKQIEMLSANKKDSSGGGIKAVGKALQKRIGKFSRRV